MSVAPTEITVRAIFFAGFLAVLLAASNAYLGLKVGITVSASIPAAILSMSILRYFKNYSVLESNIVQTGASAGEALISGIIFVLPALLLLGYWDQFNYWETTLIALTGGVLGTFFSVPLRRVLLNDTSLKFPEGTAIGQLLKLSQGEEGKLKELVQGGVFGGLIGLCQSGFQCIGQQLSLWFHGVNHLVVGFSLGFEPALLAAGYIVGIEVACSMSIGLLINWISIPFLSVGDESLMMDAASQASMIWQLKLRPVGIGVMLVGGVVTIIRLLKPILAGFRSSLTSLKTLKQQGYTALPAQERDLPIQYTALGVLLTLIPTGVLLHHFLNVPAFGFSGSFQGVSLGLGLCLILIAGFFFAALGGYFAGLLGGSNSPISSVSLLSLLAASLLWVSLLSGWVEQHQGIQSILAAQGFAIILGTIITTTSAITNNTIQDLKAGQIIQATPWKQQVIMLFGVSLSALVIAPILSLLYNAYGIGDVFPRSGMDPTHSLAAPQATMMHTLVKGAFSYQLPWASIGIGCLIGVSCIVLDRLLQRKIGSRLPVLAVGSGIYLPDVATSAIVLGGLVSGWVNSRLKKRSASEKKAVESKQQKGLSAACGLVAGASLMGVVLAIPFALFQSTEVLRIMPEALQPWIDIIGILPAFGILYWIYRVVCK